MPRDSSGNLSIQHHWKRSSRDELMQSAVLHQFLVLGEATKRLSDEFRNANPELPWRQMAGMRDNLIHEYDTIDLDLVWRTATENIPDLIKDLDLLIEE